MSKKNNKDTKRRRHEYDKRCESCMQAYVHAAGPHSCLCALWGMHSETRSQTRIQAHEGLHQRLSASLSLKLTGEAEAKEKKEKVQLKKAEKKIDKDQPIHKKKKAFRIRKGVQLRVGRVTAVYTC